MFAHGVDVSVRTKHLRGLVDLLVEPAPALVAGRIAFLPSAHVRRA
jgi:hypothetical protein